MDCPAVQYGNDMRKANANRQNELIKKIKDAGVINEFLEFLRIESLPNKAYSERLSKKI